MQTNRAFKSLVWVLIVNTSLLIGAANTHVHMDSDVIACDICLVADNTKLAVDTGAVVPTTTPRLTSTRAPVALPLQQAILGFLIRGPPTALPA